jgi:hypothetical protein
MAGRGVHDLDLIKPLAVERLLHGIRDLSFREVPLYWNAICGIELSFCLP